MTDMTPPFRIPNRRQKVWIDRRFFHTQREADERLIAIAAHMGFNAASAVAGCTFSADSEQTDYLAVKAQAYINNRLERGFTLEWQNGNLVCERRLSTREAAYADYQKAERVYRANLEFGASDSVLAAAKRKVVKTYGIWHDYVNAQHVAEANYPEGA